jgi:hypothetical protein
MEFVLTKSQQPKVGTRLTLANGSVVKVTSGAPRTAADGTPLIPVVRTRTDGRQQRYYIRIDETSEAGQREDRVRNREERSERRFQRQVDEYRRQQGINSLFNNINDANTLPLHFEREGTEMPRVTAEQAMQKQLEQQRRERRLVEGQPSMVTNRVEVQRRPITVRLPDEAKRYKNSYFNENEPESNYNRRYNTLFDYQVEDAERVLSELQNKDGFLIANAPGLGKTATALATIKAMQIDHGKKRFLVVVPTRGKQNLLNSWKQEAAGFGIATKNVKNLLSDSPESEGVYVVGYDDLRKLQNADALQFDYGVFDEIHNAAAEKTTQTKNTMKMIGRCTKTLYMSATPFTDVSEMGWMENTGLFEAFGGWKEFQKKFDYRKRKNESPETAEAQIVRKSKLLNKFLVSQGYMIQRVANLRGLHNFFGTHKLTEEQIKVLNKGIEAFTMVKSFAAQAGLGGKTSMFVGAMFAGWYRHYLEYTKIPIAAALAKKAIQNGKQPVILSAYNVGGHTHLYSAFNKVYNDIIKVMTGGEMQALNEKQRAQLAQISRQFDLAVKNLPNIPPITGELTKRLGGANVVAEIHGNTNKKTVEEHRAFQKGEKRVLVGSMAKGGTGISFHDVRGDSPRVQINMTLPYSDKEYEQVVGRTHRLTPDLRITEMYWLQTDSQLDQREATRVGRRLSNANAMVAGNPLINVATSTLTTGGRFGAEREASILELIDWEKLGEQYSQQIHELNMQFGERIELDTGNNEENE